MARTEPTTLRRPRKTVRDLLALPDEVRAELIEGQISVTPAPTTRHQRVAFAIARAIEGWAQVARTGMAIPAPYDVHLPSGAVVQPDIVFVSTPNLGIVRDAVHGVPDLLVEVVSPAHAERDLVVKRALYAENGVPELWLVPGDEDAIEVLRLERGRYVSAGYHRRGTALSSPSLPGFALAVDDVFDRVMP